MLAVYLVRLWPDLRTTVETWDPDDQDILLGLIAAFEDDGLDIISGANRVTVPGLTVEFVEPGETPDMVWARLFIDLDRGPFAVRLDCRDRTILLGVG